MGRTWVRSSALAWAVFGVVVALAVAAVVLSVLNLPTPTPQGMSFGSKVIEVPFPLLMLSSGIVGLLIVLRRSGNAVGWVMIAFAVEAELLMAVQEYGLFATVTAPGSLPAGLLATWIASWIWTVASASFPLMPLLFPSGRLLSRRWWVVVGLAVVGSLAEGVADALRSLQDPAVTVESPVSFRPPLEALEVLFLAGSVTWTIAMFAAAWSLVLRHRAAGHREQQQLKWFMWSGFLVAGVLAFASLAFGDPTWGEIAAGASALCILLIPAAVGIAILRYRLYDIDRLIDRTIVYGTLSAIIAATYIALVVVFQTILRPITGGSELAVAASTLATLALIQPLTHRIQDAVDRRFYRSRYDAARTLDSFTARLRDEVDLDALRRDLLDVLGDTVRPAHASVWLRRTG